MATVPELPDFLQRRVHHYHRSVHNILQGPDAGRHLHVMEHGPEVEEGADAPFEGTVLMVHGNPTWSFLWRKVIDALEDFHCVAPDLLGLGYSSRLPKLEDHTVERHADAVAELVTERDLGPLILVGQDWGGPIVTAVGRRVEDRVRGVVLGNTSVLLSKKPLRSLFHRAARWPIASRVLFQGLPLVSRMLHQVQGDPASISGDVARAYREPLSGIRDRATPLALARMVPDGPDHPSVPELEQLEAWIRAFSGPVELVWGTKDPILGRALRRHQKALPNAKITTTEAGHFLQEEVPGELAAAVRRVADAIRGDSADA
ncbi:MAG: alpha/beta fold hydrolase [Acidobacteriota bacterium]